MNPVAVTGIAFGASLLAALSGGSSSMVTTPAWVALGATFPTAVAADKLAGTFWTLAAARTYLTRETADRRLLIGMGLSGLLGAASGALVATALDENLLRRAGGLLILAALALSVRRPRPEAPRAHGRSLPALLAYPLGVYEGVLGSGNAILTSVMLQRTRGFELLRALGHYYGLASAWCALAASVYIARGAFELSLALPAMTGSVLGGALGARLGRKAGTGLVRPLFLAAGLVLALRLILA